MDAGRVQKAASVIGLLASLVEPIGKLYGAIADQIEVGHHRRAARRAARAAAKAGR